VPVTSSKGVTGHCVGAAGAIEAVVALQTAVTGLVPPTANHTTTDPELTVDVVAATARQGAPGPVMSNSFGFGGHNATLILGPPPRQ
jgi:3-oxoacyl-[acyl-carrier-protein] synthase II